MLDLLRSIPLEFVAKTLAKQYAWLYKSQVDAVEESATLLEQHELGIVYKIVGGPRESLLIDMKNGYLQLRTVGVKVIEQFSPNNPRHLASEFTLNQVCQANEIFNRLYPNVYLLPEIRRYSSRVEIQVEYLFQYPYSPQGLGELLSNFMVFDQMNNDYQKIINDVGEQQENRLLVASEFQTGLEIKSESDEED